jgi:hypothetical protein
VRHQRQHRHQPDAPLAPARSGAARSSRGAAAGEGRAGLGGPASQAARPLT